MNTNELHPVYLCDISYEVGEICDVNDIKNDGETHESIELLKERGISNYSKLSDKLEDIILEQVITTLSKSNVKAEDIDGVMVVTESFSEIFDGTATRGDTVFRTMRNKLFASFSKIGIQKKVFLSSTFGGSGNFLNAMFIGFPLIQTGKLTNLLVVCADQNPNGVSRYMEEALAVAGDGVAVCLLTNAPRCSSTFQKIEYVGISPFSTSDEWESLGEAVLEMYRSTKFAAADCYEQTSRQPGEFDWLVMNNYNDTTMDIFSKLLGFSKDRTFSSNISRTGHIPACDILVNLKDLSKSSPGMKAGSKTMVYVNSPYACGAISLIHPAK